MKNMHSLHIYYIFIHIQTDRDGERKRGRDSQRKLEREGATETEIERKRGIDSQR